MNSIRRRLLLALSGALVLAGVLAAVATYVSARQEVDDLLDQELRQVALLLRNYSLLDLRRLESATSDPEQRVLVQVWDPAFEAPRMSRRVPPLPRMTGEGWLTLEHVGREWRVYTLQSGQQTIQVAQPTLLRTELAAAAAGRLLIPVLIVLPLLALAGWWIVGRGLAPLSALAQAVGRRSPTSLAPIEVAGAPEELRPLAAALNDLLARLDQSFQAQRRFAADAAHELRTPLTALSLQVQLAERASTDADRARALERLKQGVARATRLVQQLLTMARLDPDAAAQPFAPVDLVALAATAVDELRPVAEARGVTLTLDAPAPVTVAGSEDALRILLNNLVDNALRYTPAGGQAQVKVSAGSGGAVLQVCDSGPGIPAEERARVFDRFYRLPGAGTPGTGLGLAIASQVVGLHKGTIALADGTDGAGLCVRVELPVTADGATA